MLFITNRAFNEGQTPMNNGAPQVPRAVSFDLSNNQAEQSVYFCHRNNKNNYTEIGSQAFLTELKNSNAKEILLYLHGYSNLPEPAIFPRTEELQRLFDLKSPGYMLVVPLIWPCDNDLGQIQDYFDDQIAADQSGVAFARLFKKFLAWRENNSTVDHPCTKRINILAHSMGNRVLRATFASIVQYFLPQGMPLVFRNIFMASADIVNEALEPGQEGQYISPAARNVVVYYAADDLAMRASKVANVGEIASRRLGHTGPENMNKVNKNVYALDCDNFNTDYDPPNGHHYFTTDDPSDPSGNPGLLFDHMWLCIETGRVPMNPPDARTGILG
jgi:esterase/lipase superfamily enzyme